MASRTDTAGTTKAFDYPVMNHRGELLCVRYRAIKFPDTQ